MKPDRNGTDRDGQGCQLQCDTHRVWLSNVSSGEGRIAPDRVGSDRSLARSMGRVWNGSVCSGKLTDFGSSVLAKVSTWNGCIACGPDRNMPFVSEGREQGMKKEQDRNGSVHARVSTAMGPTHHAIEGRRTGWDRRLFGSGNGRERTWV